MSTNTNLVSAVMDLTMAVADSITHEVVTEGTDKSGVIVTRVAAHARRGAFAPQRSDESFAQYQERLRAGRMAESERKRNRRAALKTGVFNKAVDTLAGSNIAALPGSVAGNRASLEDRQLAVAASVPLKELHTRATEDVIAGLTTRYAPFSKAQYKRGHYDAFVMNNDAPYSVWPRYHGITTRDPETIKQHLDKHFNRVATRGTWHTAGYSLKGTRMERTALNESVYRAMNAAQRSKANPLLRIGVTPDSMPYVNTFVSASPAPFTQTERLDHSRVSPTAGASDKMVAKHAPTQGMDKQGKALPFTYGGSVPPIPSDMHGLWCDRSLGGIYGNGQTDIAYRPVLKDRKGKVIDDSPRDVTKASLFTPRNIRFEKRTAREFSEVTLMCATGKQVTRPSIAAAGTVTPALTVASYPRIESCYI